jgi:elongator complex protein 3
MTRGAASKPAPAAPLQPLNSSAARAACVAEITQELMRAYDARASVNINQLKQSLSSKHGLSCIPKLIELIAALPEDYRDKLSPYLRTKPVRSASGVAVVAVMCKPHRCPHLAFTGGVCVYW